MTARRSITLKTAEDGGVDWDEVIGSILERWLTTTYKSKCRFCRKPVSKDMKPPDQFCSKDCKEKWQKIMEARLVIGKRDLDRRGYD